MREIASVLKLVLANTKAAVIAKGKSAGQPSKARYRTDAGRWRRRGNGWRGCWGVTQSIRSWSWGTFSGRLGREVQSATQGLPIYECHTHVLVMVVNLSPGQVQYHDRQLVRPLR